ncbi:LodA/GoxA family CTQ-dependent oxidase [Rhizobium beringeri]|uniref:LodA/GoxA family CTQ-dependent oxidase n=1 Tax=Rhizobium beringeri TaxID=3019934 RepID=UPI003CFB0F72
MSAPISISDPKRISALRVYPPLGLARVGNCASNDQFADDYLISTEVVGGTPIHLDGSPAKTVDDYRGTDSSIRRHAARFRIYATLDDGTVGEITLAPGVQVEWRVALANLKAGWYQFLQAMDLPDGIAKDAPRRNSNVTGSSGNRPSLDICPQPRSISGASLKGPQFQFSDGTFRGQPVYLGELRTDRDGRLIVLGGRGRSTCYPPNTALTTFANNDDWYDDIADGPVRATIRFPDGTAIDAEPGYVAVTPPNFAPGLVGVVTMEDSVRETYISQGWLKRPTSTSFSADIWPIFKRLTDLQWVNQGLYFIHGQNGPLDVDAPEVFARLRDASPNGADWRKSILALFRREQDLLSSDPGLLPQIYGDAEGEVADPACLAVTRTQLEHLQRWAAGDFTEDWTGQTPIADFASLSAADQVVQLERAALYDCLGGPFHPGIELTWTMRIPYIWEAPYRLKINPSDAPARQDWGDILSPSACLAAGGPYDGVSAGALTRFMGVPWQSDGASCNSSADYNPGYFLSMPTFWGARVPDQVLSHESAVRVSANVQHGHDGQAAKYFANRSDWLRDIRSSGYFKRISLMVREWHDLGMVLPLGEQIAGFPDPIRVEQGRSKDFVQGDVKPALMGKLEGDEQHQIALFRATWSGAQAADPPTGRPRRSYRQGEI